MIDARDLENRLDANPRRARRFLARLGGERFRLPTGAVWKLGELIVEQSSAESFCVSEISDYVQTADVDALFPNEEKQFNADFWSGPPPLYHNTTRDNVESIDAEGLATMDKTRGFTNRWTGHAVFTTTSGDEAFYATYGNALYTIDTAAMKRAGYMPPVAEEEPYREYNLRQRLAYILDEEIHIDVETGISPYTVVVFGAIPPEYLSREWLGPAWDAP